MLGSFKHNIKASKIKNAYLDLDDLFKLFSIVQELIDDKVLNKLESLHEQ